MKLFTNSKNFFFEFDKVKTKLPTNQIDGPSEMFMAFLNHSGKQLENCDGGTIKTSGGKHIQI